jgi:hypothetical protein
MRCDEEASREGKRKKKGFGELIGKERESLREKMKNDTDTKIDIYIYIYIYKLLYFASTALYCTVLYLLKITYNIFDLDQSH